MADSMTFCDEQGIPRTVQRIQFNYAWFGYYVTLFTGAMVFVPCDAATPHLGLMEYPREAEYRDVYYYVNEHIDEYLPAPRRRLKVRRYCSLQSISKEKQNEDRD
jgi:hypothetical protein